MTASGSGKPGGRRQKRQTGSGDGPVPETEKDRGSFAGEPEAFTAFLDLGPERNFQRLLFVLRRRGNTKITIQQIRTWARDCDWAAKLAQALDGHDEEIQRSARKLLRSELGALDSAAMAVLKIEEFVQSTMSSISTAIGTGVVKIRTPADVALLARASVECAEAGVRIRTIMQDMIPLSSRAARARRVDSGSGEVTVAEGEIIPPDKPDGEKAETMPIKAISSFTDLEPQAQDALKWLMEHQKPKQPRTNA